MLKGFLMLNVWLEVWQLVTAPDGTIGQVIALEDCGGLEMRRQLSKKAAQHNTMIGGFWVTGGATRLLC